MLKRFATVIWWIGVMSLLGGAISTIGGTSMSERFVSFACGAIGAIVAFSFTYILGGTFLKPPTGPLSR